MRQKNREDEAALSQKSMENMQAAIRFLTRYMPETLAKRVFSMVLIAAGIDNVRITELTGYCDRSVRSLRKELRKTEPDYAQIFTIGGGGRKSKIADVEDEILEELEKGNYQTRQQICDMIYEKFNISISPSAIGKFLKKSGVSK